MEENLSIFFSEDSYMSSVIKMGAEKSFTSHSAKIKDFLTRGIGGGTIMEGATPTRRRFQLTRGVNLLAECADLLPVDLYLYLC